MGIFRVMFHALLLCSQCLRCEACDFRFTKDPLIGHFCTGTSNTQITLWNTDHPRCMLSCIVIKTCRYINHNYATNQCILGLDQCETLLPMVGGTVNVLGPLRDTCLSWGSKNEPGRDPVNLPIRVARELRDGVLVVGKVDPDGTFYANDQGVRVISGVPGIEYLTKDPTCTVLWMPYMAGGILPVGVVTGGRLLDGSITYVSKIDSYVIGYYDEGTQQAYYEWAGTGTTTTMEVLVLL